MSCENGANTWPLALWQVALTPVAVTIARAMLAIVVVEAEKCMISNWQFESFRFLQGFSILKF